ncbi:hypothetical protein ACOTWR_06775 [Aliarcobacter butzleri]
MTALKPGTKVIICEDTIECSDAVLFLESLIGKTLEIVEVTNEYKDENLPTYKCKYEDGSIVKAGGIEYFPFVDSDLKVKINIDRTLTKNDVIKNDIIHNIFCLDEDNNIMVPTFKELVAAGEILPLWKLSEDYSNYSYDSIINIINEKYSDFLETLYALDTFNENEKKKKKYGYRTYIEYGTPIEIIEKLQEIHALNDEVDIEDQFIILQSSITHNDFSSIEVLVQCEIIYGEVKQYLKRKLDVSFHDEIDKLIEVIKEAKDDNHDTLHIYDC